jgi:hypothetical protein
MSGSRKRGLIIALIVCLALAILIPNILVIVFAGAVAKPVLRLVILCTIVAVLVCGYFGLYGLVIALTKGPVAPTTLLKLLHRELIGDTSRVKKNEDGNAP